MVRGDFRGDGPYFFRFADHIRRQPVTEIFKIVLLNLQAQIEFRRVESVANMDLTSLTTIDLPPTVCCESGPHLVSSAHTSRLR